MKLLMLLAERFAWRAHEQTLPGAAAADGEGDCAGAAVIFVHAEPADEARRDALVTRAAKNVKWIANKRGYRRVVLHSFTHLAQDKADPAFARDFLEALCARLASAGYEVRLTPFGHTCAWEISVHGETLAKVFKSL